MASPLLEIEWEVCPLPKGRDPELESYVRKHIGMVPKSLPYLVSCPLLVRADFGLSFAHGLLTELDLELAEEVGMAVSQEGSCRFCYSVSRALMRIQGMSEAQLRTVEARLAVTSGGSRETAAIAFARRLARANPLVTIQELRQLVTSGFSATEAKELAFVAAYMVMANRISTLCALPPQEMERMPDMWLVRSIRPLLSWMISRNVRHGEPVASVPAGDTPHTQLIEAYSGLPIAPALERVFREAWLPSLLSRRCKALIFAVVGRGIGCDLSEAIAARICAEEGFGGSALSDVLNHLRSPELDTMENALVPFARQSIWYRPVQIQREAKQLLQSLSIEQFLEAVGIISMANAFCRLNAAVMEHH